MKQSIFTMILPVLDGQQAKLRGLLTQCQYLGRAPENDPLHFTELSILHYASVFLFDDPVYAWQMVWEFNIDGEIDEFLRHFVAVIYQDAFVLGLFQHCRDIDVTSEALLLEALKRAVQLPSAAYSGCTGRSVAQIQFEQLLYTTVSDCLDKICREKVTRDGNSKHLSKQEVINRIWQAVDHDGRLTGIHNIPSATPAASDLLAAQRIADRAPTEPVIPSAAFRILRALAWQIRDREYIAFAKSLCAVLVFLIFASWNAIRKEPSAAEDSWPVDAGQHAELTAFEDHLPSNHMVSIVYLHTDLTRRFGKWAALHIVNLLASKLYVHGVAGVVPSIHFAHWSIVHEHTRLMFVSNFDGSWDSYLDDFTLKAADSLTLAWAYSKGIPKTTLMLFGGAAKGPAFFDWARRSMVPSLVWYNAYPHLSVRHINRNSALRQLMVNDVRRENQGNWLELMQ